MKQEYIKIDESLEALLYDWHNSLKLRQNEDISFYSKYVSINNLKNILIVGAVQEESLCY